MKRGAGTPKGFVMSVDSISPGCRARATSSTTSDRPETQATGRQRCEGRWPSGKSSSKKVAAGPIPAIQIQSVSHAVNVTTAAPGWVWWSTFR